MVLALAIWYFSNCQNRADEEEFHQGDESKSKKEFKSFVPVHEFFETNVDQRHCPGRPLQKVPPCRVGGIRNTLAGRG